MSEIFKDIPGYEGFYQVSNMGNVKSLKRIDSNNHPIKERILKSCPTSGGYLIVGFSNKNKRKSFTIHQLVAIAFLNHIPCEYKIVIDHIDFNRKNNHLSNLRIISQRENANQIHLKSSSKYVGVSWKEDREKWLAQIRINGIVKYLGLFKNELDAAMAYENALNQI